MASFDAGSIEARLTLDRSPFSEGLRLAKAEADRFGDFEVTLRLNTTGTAAIERLKAELASIGNADVGIDLHNAGLAEQIARIKEDLDSIDGRRVSVTLEALGVDRVAADLAAIREEAGNLDGKHIDVRVDTHGGDELLLIAEEVRNLDGKTINLHTELSGQLALFALQEEVDHLDGKNIDINVDTAGATAQVAALAAEMSILERIAGQRESFEAPGMMMTAIAVLAPVAATAIVPLAAGLAGFASAGFAAAGGIGAIVLAVKPMLTDFEKQEKALTAAEKRLDTLTPGTTAYANALREVNQRQQLLNDQYGPLVAGLDQWHTAYNSFKADTKDGAETIIVQALALGSDVIGRLVPVFDAFAPVVTGAISALRAFVNGPEMVQLIRVFTESGPGALNGFMRVIGNLILTFTRLAETFAPFGASMVDGLAKITAGWADWAGQVHTTKGFQDFLDYAKTEGPALLSTIKQLAEALINVGKGMAPLGAMNLSAMKVLAEAISHLPPDVITALAVAFEAWTIGMWAYSAATTAAAIASTALDIAASPILLAVGATIGVFILAAAAVVALGIGIYELATKTQFFQTIWNAVWDAAKAVWDVFTAGISAGIDGLTAAWDAITSATQTAWDAVTGAISSAGDAILGAVRAVLDWFEGVWATFWNSAFGGMIKAAFGAIVAFIQLEIAVIRFAFEWWLEGVKYVFGEIGKAWDWLYDHTAAVLGWIKDHIVAAWDYVHDRTVEAWNKVKSAVSGPLDAIKNTVSGWLDTIKGWITGAWDYVHDRTVAQWESLVSAVSGPLGRVKTTVSNAIQDIKDFFAGAANWLLNAGEAIVDGLINGITNKINAVKDKMHELTSIITDHLPGSPVKTGPLMVLNNGYAGGLITQMIADGVAGNAHLVRQAIGDAADLAGMELGGTGFINSRLGITPGGGSPTAPDGAPAAGGGGGADALLAEMAAMRRATEAMTEEFKRQNDNALTLKRQGAT